MSVDVLEDLLARFGEHLEKVPSSLTGVFVTTININFLHCNENTLYAIIMTNDYKHKFVK